MRLKTIFVSFLLAVVNVTAFCSGATYQPSTATPPKPVREFRGAWVATVHNAVWPSRKGLSTAEQKTELIAILDNAAKLKLNAIVFQVRPACDALYASQLEPWSEYLSGTMGQAPKPFYDPLAFVVEEAHKRGLELHAWFNPYRARTLLDKSSAAANHISKTRPQLVRQYGKQLWLDPGEREVQDYSIRVIMDVVKRYDIDAVHMDDYFYPYQVKDDSGKNIDFPDDASWQRYGAGGKLNRDDWRRENVNAFVQRLAQSIKAAKPWVRFGISPFGIWRPGHPQQIKGLDAYAQLYADSRKWLASGWVDYLAPQLYWSIDASEQSYPVLLKWWAEQNEKGRHLWPGLDATRVGEKRKPEEIVEQIRLARKQPGASGHIHWSMKSLMRNRSGLADALVEHVYSEPALVPSSPWLDARGPDKPKLAAGKTKEGAKASWSSAGREKVWLWLLQTKVGERWTTEILPANKTSLMLSGSLPNIIAVTGLDRVGNASAPAVVQMKSR